MQASCTYVVAISICFADTTPVTAGFACDETYVRKGICCGEEDDDEKEVFGDDEEGEGEGEDGTGYAKESSIPK